MTVLFIPAVGCDRDSPTAPPTDTAAISSVDVPGAQRVVTVVEARTKTVDDNDIAYAVRIRLNALEDVTRHIDVTVNDGVVKLGGHAPTLAAVYRAAEAATFVLGVTDVKADVEIRGAERDDDELHERVKLSIAHEPATLTSDIGIETNDGKVTLTGQVGSFEEKRAAEQAAAMVSGVTAIDNQIAVTLAEPRSDAEIAADVKSALDWDALISAKHITIQVDDGVVTLNGRVRSLAERHRAEELAWVAGAREVDAEGIGIQWWKVDDLMDPSPPSVENEELAAVIERRLMLEPSVPHDAIQIHVDEDAVHLSGTVSTYAAKRKAADIVRSMRVPALDDTITVKPEAMTDELLEKELEQRIDENPWVDASDVNVEVSGGAVKLMGAVDNELEILEAQRAVSNHPGVSSIENELSLSKNIPTTPGDEELATEIDLALTHDPFIDATGVRIEVTGGFVQLAGTVSESTRKRAIQAAHDAGAKKVDASKLIVVGG
jgi:osmotically-inducible protein OsmY